MTWIRAFHWNRVLWSPDWFALSKSATVKAARLRSLFQSRIKAAQIIAIKSLCWQQWIVRSNFGIKREEQTLNKHFPMVSKINTLRLERLSLDVSIFAISDT